VWRGIRALESRGVPNGFGPQRFGMRGDNHLLGAMLLQDRLGELADLLCGESMSGTVEGRRAAAARARGADAAATVRAVAPPTRELWLDAWQSAVFNRVLDARIADGTFDRVLPGDVAVKHANGAMFAVDDAAIAEEGERAPAARAARFEISATGPLPGPDAMRASGAVAEAERAAIAATGVDPARLEAAGTRPSGDRRPLRVRLSNPELESGFDEHGPYVRVAFDLPPGAYATVVLREALGDGLVDASRDAARS
jgi:tRNA pseudouridine13 synthase